MTPRPPSAPPVPLAIARGLPAGLAYLAVAAVVQAQDLILYTLPALPREGWSRHVLRVLALPLLQLENVAVAALLALLVGLASRWRALRVAAAAVAALAGALTVVDQLVYKLYLSHFDVNLVEGPAAGVVRLLDSALAEATPVTAPDLALVAAGAALVWLPSVEAACARAARRAWDAVDRSGGGQAALVAFVLGSAWVAWGFEHHQVHRNPLVGLALAALERPMVAAASDCAPETDLASLCDGEGQGPPAALAEVRARAAARAKRPNVLLVVLESVGDPQLFADGRPRADAAPRLRALADRALVFERVYAATPATTRSHLLISTGGRAPTWGGVLQTLDGIYAGPTLAGTLRDAGYRTALVSAQGLGFGDLAAVFRAGRFQYTFDPDHPDDPSVRDHALSSWGVDEAVARDAALRFIDEGAGASAPFFLELLTSSTHHPYVTPKGWAGARPGGGRRERYDNALRYTDHVIGELLDGLAARGLLEDTIVAVTGDHGEAFSDVHPGNVTHSRFLYEENVRSFLLVADAATVKAPIASPEIAGLGDIAPTLLSLAGVARPADMPGQDLLSPSFRPRLEFFHKSSNPMRWGLRDGRWKFIGPQTGRGDEELYDLDADPDERRNRAAERPEMVDRYECLCRAWYLHANDEFIARFDGKGARGGARLRERDLKTPGPKVLAFGTVGADGAFLAASRLPPDAAVHAVIEWMPDGRGRDALLEWRGPTGALYGSPIAVGPDGYRTDVVLAAPAPLAAGTWRAVLRDGTEGPALLTGSFDVSPAARPPRAP